MDEVKEMVDCPSCHVKLNLPRQFSGMIGCPKCKFEFTVGDKKDSETSNRLSDTAVVKTKLVKKYDPNADILTGLKILAGFWTMCVVYLFISLLAVGQEWNTDDSSETDGITNYDEEDLEDLERNAIAISMIIPGIHMYAFYLIYRGTKELLSENGDE